METILVTGAAGFIGSHMVYKLLDSNYQVIGVDSLNDYYDTDLKKQRINISNENYIFIKQDVKDKEKIKEIFDKYKPTKVLHLAAYAGVRYSLDNPDVYIENNIVALNNLLDVCKEYNIEHFIFASSSSVYGDDKFVPYSESLAANKPESIYASTKKCGEMLTYTYSSLYNINVTCVRLFSVYGPFGRPDMAYFDFTKKLINKEKIYLHNNGDMKRDFTYIDDIVDGIYKITSNKPIDKYNIYNIGSSRVYTLFDLVNIIKKEIKLNNLVDEEYDLDSLIEYSNKDKGEVYETYADTSKINKDYGYSAKYTLEEGIHNFIKWYEEYYIDKK